MTVDVLVIIAFRQFAELPAEAFTTRIVYTTAAPAIASPIAKTFHDDFEAHVSRDVYSPTLTHRHMMRRIKRLRGKIPKSARRLRSLARESVATAQRITVIFD